MSKQERYAGASALQGLSLGQQSAYISQYTPSLLQPVPRSLNRDDLGLGETLPFQGCDVWTLYELSWLNAKGKPVVALGEVAVPAYLFTRTGLTASVLPGWDNLSSRCTP